MYTRCCAAYLWFSTTASHFSHNESHLSEIHPSHHHLLLLPPVMMMVNVLYTYKRIHYYVKHWSLAGEWCGGTGMRVKFLFGKFIMKSFIHSNENVQRWKVYRCRCWLFLFVLFVHSFSFRLVMLMMVIIPKIYINVRTNIYII